MDIDLLINRKKNAEIYKEQISALKEEISQLKSKKTLTMFLEEKKQYEQEIENKEQELEECQAKYNEKRTLIEDDIEKEKNEFKKQYKEMEGRKIAKKDYEELAENKKEKEEELKQYTDIEIPELQEKINSVTNKALTMGYDFDIASLAKDLENKVAYKTYLQEEIDGINARLDDSIVVEDNMEKLKNVSYFDMRLADLNYDNLENWYEKELQNSVQDSLVQDPPVQDPPMQDPPVQDPLVQDPPVQDPPVQDPPVQNPPVQNPPVTQPQTKLRKTKNGFSKILKSSIKIDAQSGRIYYTNEKNDQVKEAGIEYPKEYWNDKHILNLLAGIAKRYDIEPEVVARRCDPNIINMLADNPNELECYVDAIYGEKQLPINFEVSYNLKGMYDVDFLKNSEKRYMARRARYAGLVGAKVEKDALLDRIKGFVKSHVSKNTRNKLVEAKKKELLTNFTGGDIYSSKEKESIMNFKGSRNEFLDFCESLKQQNYDMSELKSTIYIKLKEYNNVPKENFIDKLKVAPRETMKQLYHYTSDKLNKSKLLNSVKMNSKIVGRKITGYVNGENPLKVKSDVNKIKEDYQSR